MSEVPISSDADKAESSVTSSMITAPEPLTTDLYSSGLIPADTQEPLIGPAAALGKPAWDMETLKAAIYYAQSGSGEVRKAIETCTFRPREAAFTALINLCGKVRDSAKAFEVFETMKDYRGVKPNTYTYSSLISACSSSGDLDKAMDVFKAMKGAATVDPGCKPNEVTYSALITACERGGKYSEALALFDELLRVGLSPDKATFSSAVAACQKSERWERAEQLVEDMHSKGFSGTSSIYFDLLQHYGAQGDWNKGLDLFLTMQCYDAPQMMGHQVDGHLCRALMNAFEASGRYAMALQLLDTMDKEIDTDLDTYNSALRTLAKAARWKEAAEVVDRIIEAGLQPNQETARAAVDACVAGEKKDDARRIIDKIEASGTVVDDEIKVSTQ